jgi:hypothetical protein
MHPQMVRMGLILAMVVPWASTSLWAQSQAPVDRVQAAVYGLHSAQQAHHIDIILNGLQGVLLSRTDVHSRNLFLFVRSDSPVNEAQLQQLLKPMGVRIGCWSRAPRTDEPFHPVDADHCADLEMHK